MDLLESKTYLKPDIFGCMKIIQHISRIFGIICMKNGFGFNFDSIVFIVIVVYYGDCALCIISGWRGCDCTIKITNKSTLVMMTGGRLIPLGMLFCIIKFAFSNVQVNQQMLNLLNQLKEKNAGFVSFKYNRRNLAIASVFIVWIFVKAITLIDVINMIVMDKEEYLRRVHLCTYMNSWPLLLFNWQFLLWMQVLSGALKISSDELRRTIIKSQETSDTGHDKIIACVTQVKVVLEFKEKVLDKYGFSIALIQFQCGMQIIFHAYWNIFIQVHSRMIYIIMTMVLSFSIFILPHWMAQEITSEGTEMLHCILKLQVQKKPRMIDEKLRNFLFGFLHEDLRFRVCNIFYLNHQQFLSLLSLSAGFLIVQLQLIV